MCEGRGERERGREGEKGKERDKETERERERELVVYRKVWDFFFPLILFHVMSLVLQRRNGTEKNTLLLLTITPSGQTHSRCLAFPSHICHISLKRQHPHASPLNPLQPLYRHCNFGTIRCCFFPQICPLHLIVGTALSVNKFGMNAFLKNYVSDISNPYKSAWNKNRVPWHCGKLISSINTAHNCRHGIWKEQ